MENKKNFFINLGIIVGVIIFVIIVLYIKSLVSCPNPQEKIVECIANNSVLYIQAGCPHCDKQKEKFGECSKMLNIIDCTKTPEKCINANIKRIPCWVINETIIEGVYEINELKEMMNC